MYTPLSTIGLCPYVLWEQGPPSFETGSTRVLDLSTRSISYTFRDHAESGRGRAEVRSSVTHPPAFAWDSAYEPVSVYTEKITCAPRPLQQVQTTSASGVRDFKSNYELLQIQLRALLLGCTAACIVGLGKLVLSS